MTTLGVTGIRDRVLQQGQAMRPLSEGTTGRRRTLARQS